MGRPVWFKIDDITDKPRGLLLPGKIAQSIKLAISPFVSAVTAALEIAGTVDKPDNTQTFAARAFSLSWFMPVQKAALSEKSR